MPIQRVNDVDLFYESVGDGYPLLMVHGSWTDRFGWSGVVPGLSDSFRVITYDRRGHGNSEKPGNGVRRDDEDDLAALIEALDIAPCHLATNSFGSSISLAMTARRPELVRSLAVHEPPLMAIVDDPDAQRVLDETDAKITVVLDEIRAGQVDAAAKRFVEEVALGPGMWDQLPGPIQQTFKTNAPTWANEQADEGWPAIDLDALGTYSGPVLLSEGDQSPPFFAVILARLQRTLKKAQREMYPGAGHVPHMTHPDAYVEKVTAFIKSTA
ncbi:MAG: alpha/beta fold hydrolase [Actinomycetota bacterium]